MTVQSCLAIDYGTTNTVATVVNGPSLQRLKFGNDWRLPSAVYWDARSGPVVGVNAERSQRLDPTRFVRCPKRETGYSSLMLGGHPVPVVAVVAALLGEVRTEVLAQFGALPQRVVLTWPVHWASQRRQLFQEAVQASGFSGAQFLEEPVAAAIRVGTLGQVPSDTPFAVVDFGGGTLDVAVLVRAGARFDVLASDGADPLGGEDIDDLLFDRAVAELDGAADVHRLLNSMDPTWTMHRSTLRGNCRMAKEQLSEMSWGAIGIPFTGTDVTLTRSEFEALADRVVRRAVTTLRDTVEQAGFEPDQVPVYLVGGSSRMPILAGLIRRELGTEVRTLGDVQFVVSEGAALWAAERPGAERGRLIFLQGAEAVREYRSRLDAFAEQAQDRLGRVLKDPSPVTDQARILSERAGQALQDVSRRTQDAARAAQERHGIPPWVWLVVAALVVLVLIVLAS